MNCVHNISCIHNVPIFKQLSDDEKQTIMNRAINKTFKKGETIFTTFDSSANLWVVNRGKVKIVKISSDGKEQVMRILNQGEFLGELSLFSNEKMTSNAYAMENTEICIISGDEIKKTIRQNPEIAIKFLEVYAKRIKESEEMIEKIGVLDIEQRIAKTLLDELNQAKNNEIILPFSKTDFASIIGTTRETLSRKLAKFQEFGWIRLSGQRKIIILDKTGLKRLLI